MFLPTTRAELEERGWAELDVVLVTGDSYIDSAFIGAALIGKLLAQRGYRVGLIGQPETKSDKDISRLGEPRLFWGVTAGAVDSMVANYTALNRRRWRDDYTPGGRNDRRPDRATIVYTNLIRRFFPKTRPIVLGGIEASLRRVAHYDFWSDRIRRSILLDAKADYIVYGMGESATLALARHLDRGEDPREIRGLCYVATEPPEEYIPLPSFEEVRASPPKFAEMFHTFYNNAEPYRGRGLTQAHGDRLLIQNPPQPYLSQVELDRVHALTFANAQHPAYARQGEARALDTIRFSLTTHRGCYGQCNFCAIAVHQGHTIRWRSEASLVEEAERLAADPSFNGTISDVGGPTANMYGFDCKKRLASGSCEDRRCLSPTVCQALRTDHSRQISLLDRLRKIRGVKHVFVASGIRHDMVINDSRHGRRYLQQVVKHHISGQLKLAPEHTNDAILRLMGKPSVASLLAFRREFEAITRAAGKRQFLTYYFIAAHPGCTDADIADAKRFISKELKINPRQVQVFTPLPSTYSALMYVTRRDPFSEKELFVEKNPKKKERQKAILVERQQGAGRKRRR